MNPRLTRALFGFTRPYPWVIPAMVALGVLASLAEGLGIGLLIPVLDEVVSAGSADPSQGPLTLLVRDLTSWIPADYRLVTLASVIIGLVALNINDCRSFGRNVMMRRMSSTKPMSIMRSASSRMRNSKPLMGT